jgi:hypothetical protein
MEIVDHRQDSQVNHKPDRLWTQILATTITTSTIIITTAPYHDGVGGVNGGEQIRARYTVPFGRAVISHSVSLYKKIII